MSTTIALSDVRRRQETLATLADARPRNLVAADERGGLASTSFLGLLVTQFLGAFNDNMFRWLVIPIGKQYAGKDNTALALSAGLACFVLPYVFLAAPAGYLADRFSKRNVMIACKVAEVVIMALGIAAIWLGNVYFLFVVVALMGGQSALFAPSKYGSLPEMLRPGKLSTANGLIGMTTIMAVVFGAIAGNQLYGMTMPDGTNNLWISTAALVGVAGLGLLTSLVIAPLKSADPCRAFPFNFPRQMMADLGELSRSRALLRVALGVAFFWALGSMANLNVDAYGIHELGLTQTKIGHLLAALALGVGVGSVLAGLLSGGKVELGLVPLGAGGIAVSSILLFFSTDSVALSAVCLFAVGTSAGFFTVPLDAYLQHRSPSKSRGSILAASNLLTFTATFVVSGIFWLLSGPLAVSPRGVFLLAGLSTLVVLAYTLWLLPRATIRFMVWLLSHTVYRVRYNGRANLPEEGGALLAVNHVSWIDGVLLLLSSSRPVRMLAYAPHVEGWWIRWLARIMGVIPINSGGGRKSVARSLKTAREALRNGELVCIFPEGAVTRDGKMSEFKPGVLSILKGTTAPVIPVYLDGLWGSIFSHYGGRLFWKWPTRWPYPVSISYGKPLDGVTSVDEIRHSVEAMEVESCQHN